ncbi:carboxypeptidase-like regulatory domain-containing protein [Vallitalea sp.]|jgi:predicted negative regulator of RcsB-dependent stress response|uniref:carboxypeptidase-like regulatory domain-containing protein n=1 Tax=Vallitalea sp. TaxID=1882829 RepID=UPI0025E1135E|nr:carboxypeptidase-like regulatory domain-containing protein [Vallitalea sp.]MCT4688949.1 carboxypeptidase-like regulatory domain-containing protein [Vallitalea sp.]
MKYIKIKVKYIIIVVCVIIIGYIGINYNSPDMYYLLGNINKGTTSNAYYNRLVKEHPQDQKSVLGQIRILENILNDHQVFSKVMVVIQDGFSIVNGDTRVVSEESIKDINDTYYTLLEYHRDNDYFDNYTLYTALVNWYAGYNNNALDMLNKNQFKDKDYESLRNMYLSLMNIELGNFDKALDLIEDYHDEEYDSYWDIVTNYYNFLSGKMNYGGTKHKDYINSKDTKFKIIDSLYETILSSVDIKNKKRANNTLQGVIFNDGAGVENMLVFLTSMDGVSSQMGFVYRENLVTVTDEKGQYIFHNVPNGNYNVGLCLPWNRIKGHNIEFDKGYRDIEMKGNNSYKRNINLYSPIKVGIEKIDTNRFQFKVSHDYLDFDYYKVGLSLINGDEGDFYNINYFSNTKFRGNTIYFDVDKEKESYFSIGYSSSNGTINVDSLIDALYHSGKYYLKIIGGYDDRDCWIDNYGSYSNVSIATIDIDGEEWTEGDKLLIDKKFGEAVLQYDKELKENPDNLHIHKTLAKMYMREWDDNDDESNIDYKKALEHLLVMNESIHTPEIKEAIGDCYYNLNDYETAIEYYDEDVDNQKYCIAKSYYYLNDYNNAIENYSGLIGSCLNDTVIEKMIGIYLLQDNMKGLKSIMPMYTNKYNNADYEPLTNKYINMDRSGFKVFYELINNGNIDEAYSFLNNNDSDLARFYKLLFILFENTSGESRANKFMDLYKDINQDILKDYAKNLGYDEIKRYDTYNHDNNDKSVQD